MHRRFIQLSLLLLVMLCGGTSAASTPTACTRAHCVYLPLVSTPQLVAVTNVGLEGTRSGGTAVVGEVYVTTNTPVYSVTLEVRSYDSQGQLIDTTTGIPEFTATLPGQPNPFYFGIGVIEEHEFARYDVRVLAYSRTHPRTFLPVTVNVTSYKNNGYYIDLAGTLTNDHVVPLEDIRGLAWTEKGDQRISRPYASRLEPLETIPFSTTIGYINVNPNIYVPYKIVAQGVVL